MHWNYQNQDKIESLAQLQDILLENLHQEDTQHFFFPTHPREISIEQVGINPDQLRLAIEVINQSISNNEEIIILGDYDADGICATAVLWQIIYALGGKVSPFIPDRKKHGYGISHRSLDDLLETKKPDLVITVDNGIVAHEPVARLMKMGIKVIVTDHHTIEANILPQTTAVIHTTKLCGASVAWMLARELVKGSDENLQQLLESSLDLVGIATIADMVPLKNANRSFAKFGIECLNKTTKKGLLALIEKSEIQPGQIDENSIGFAIGPRINAMGRISHGLNALRLLLTKSPQRAIQLAGLLNQTNQDRQELTLEMTQSALDQVKKNSDSKIIIVHSEAFHEGVIGLIAGQLSKKYYKPAIAISTDGKLAKASARSIAGVDIVELVRQVKEDLLEAGGHPMAAGFGLEMEKLDRVVKRLRSLADQQIDDNLLQPQINISCILPSNLVNLELVDLLEKFRPFGQGNLKPVFAIKDLQVLDIKTIGKNQKHLKLTLTGDQQKPFSALGWGKAELATQLQPGINIDVAGKIEVNEWRGRKKIQIIVSNIKI